MTKTKKKGSNRKTTPTAKQKANQERFKKVIKAAKAMHSKNPSMTWKTALSKAWKEAK